MLKRPFGQNFNTVQLNHGTILKNEPYMHAIMSVTYYEYDPSIDRRDVVVAR